MPCAESCVAVEFGSSDGVEYCVLNQLLPPPYMETSHADES